MQKRLLLLLLASALSAFGQSNYAVVTGTVMDPQHLPVAGAAIQLTAAGTGAVRHVVTDQRGLFEASALLPDDYELTTEAPGFAPDKQSVRLEVGQKLTVSIGLALGSVKQGSTSALRMKCCTPGMPAWERSSSPSPSASCRSTDEC
jgi:hypothetical protein